MAHDWVSEADAFGVARSLSGQTTVPIGTR